MSALEHSSTWLTANMSVHTIERERQDVTEPLGALLWGEL